jgi:DNA-damage-inducible protein J
MAKIQIGVRVEEDDYQLAKQILEELGISYPQAVNMFNKAIIRENGIPFELKLRPTPDTIKALEEMENGEVERFDSMEEFLKKMGEK